MLGTRAALLGAVCVLALGGCGAGQQAATANQVTASGGSAGSAGSVMVRNAQFAWSDPVPGGVVYPAGSDAALQVSIINEKSAGLGDGDRLVAATPASPTGRSSPRDTTSRSRRSSCPAPAPSTSRWWASPSRCGPG